MNSCYTVSRMRWANWAALWWFFSAVACSRADPARPSGEKAEPATKGAPSADQPSDALVTVTADQLRAKVRGLKAKAVLVNAWANLVRQLSARAPHVAATGRPMGSRGRARPARIGRRAGGRRPSARIPRRKRNSPAEHPRRSAHHNPLAAAQFEEVADVQRFLATIASHFAGNSLAQHRLNRLGLPSVFPGMVCTPASENHWPPG